MIRTSLSKYNNIIQLKYAIKRFINSLNLIYDDCTIDLCFKKKDFQTLKRSSDPEKFLAFRRKINSPVYAFVTSEMFSFGLGKNVEILLLNTKEEFDYPMILASFENGYIVEA